MTGAEFARYLRRAAQKAPRAIERGMMEGAGRVAVILAERTRNAPPASPRGASGAFDRGLLASGWRIMRVAPTHVRISNLRGYAGVVEMGRRAGAAMPPKSVIFGWLRRRLGMSTEDATRAAYVVARAIGRRGLRARRIATGAKAQIDRLLRDAVGRELERVL